MSGIRNGSWDADIDQPMILLLLRRPDTPSITTRWSKGERESSIVHCPSESSREKSRTTGWKPLCRTGRMPMFLLIQSREDFRIAHIGPFAGELERLHFLLGLREIANCVRQLVFPAWRRFQFRGEFEDARSKCVQTGVVKWNSALEELAPPFHLSRSWFFAKIDKLHPLVYKNRSAFAYVFAARDCDDCFHIFRKIDNAFVVRRINQNIAVAQDEWAVSDKITGKIDNATGPILHCLRCILNADAPARTITEKIPHSVSVIANNYEDLVDSRVAQSFDDVLQDWFAAHYDHRFGNFGRQFAHARAAPRCEYYCLINFHQSLRAQFGSEHLSIRVRLASRH